VIRVIWASVVCNLVQVVTGYNDFGLDKVLVFLMPGFFVFFRTLLLSVAASILASNFS